MVFWDKYLRNPPHEVTSPTDWYVDPARNHCVRWVGYEGGFEIDELWQFGSGMRGIGKAPPERNFIEYGGETLCGLRIKSGRKMYGPRWRSIEPDGYPFDPPDEDNLRAVLIDLHGITCMVCRNKLMYSVSRLIEDLTFIRSNLVGDWLGEDYVSREPLVHGKHVISSDKQGRYHTETYRYRCGAARESINPQMVDDVKESERITCPECLSNLAAGVIP